MKEKDQPHFQAVWQLIESHFLKTFNDRLAEHATFISKAHAKVEEFDLSIEDEKARLEAAYQYKAALLSLTDQINKSGLESYNVEYESFESAFEAYLKTLPKTKKLVQRKERYTIQPGDSLYIKFLKPLKRLCFSLSHWPRKISNGFRKLFKKELKTIEPWQHTVQYRDLTRYYLKVEFVKHLQPAVDRYYQQVAGSSKAIWELDQYVDIHLSTQLGQEVDSTKRPEIDLEQVIGELNETKKYIHDLTEASFEKSCVQFEDKLHKAGTIECSNSSFSLKRSEKQLKKLAAGFKRVTDRWNNTLLVLTDDWQIDLELYDIIYESLYEHKVVSQIISKKLAAIQSQKLDAIKTFIAEWKIKVEKVQSRNFKKLVEEETGNVTKELGTLVDQACAHIIDQEFLETVDSVEQHITRSLEKISEKRAITKGIDFSTPVRSKQINYISPVELIQFETYPQFLKVSEAAKVATNECLSNAEAVLLQMEQILDFNMETALSKFDENPNEAKKIALEGIERTITQLEYSFENLSKIQAEVAEPLHEGLQKFCNALIKFTNNENILELRVRIAKGKALERGRRLRERIINGIKNFIPLAIRFTKSTYARYQNLVRQQLKQLGIQGVTSSVTTQLADFLAETEKVIEALPVVYQRLFRARPLEDDRFFEGRVKENHQLKKALASWQDGRFAATVVVGEKGSGITSFINAFVQEKGNLPEVIRISPKHNINEVDGLITLMNEALGTKLKDFDQLVDHLNARKKHRVIVIENVQNLYLKMVGGFMIIKVLAELISVTHKNNFWIAGCTLYAYQYLDKTIAFSENFGYQINMGQLSVEDMVSVIERRHKVSGYSLVFEAGAEQANSKKFQSLELDEQQAQLKKLYFNELNKMAKSNISIALVYWIRSTTKGDNNDIIIKPLGQVDYSFINSLSNYKTELLNLLLLHDGLTDYNVAKITQQGLQKTRGVLHTLLEDGVITKTEETYYLNPLLYRQTVQMLKAKNILH